MSFSPYILPVMIGIANAISELSNHGKLRESAGWDSWWNEKSWNNKNTWKPLLGFISWRWWPLLIFTDAFYWFKFIWVVLMCLLPFAAWTQVTDAIWIFAVYSGSFQVVYFLIPYLKLR